MGGDTWPGIIAAAIRDGLTDAQVCDRLGADLDEVRRVRWAVGIPAPGPAPEPKPCSRTVERDRRAALALAALNRGRTLRQVAGSFGVTPKTVQRWTAGRRAARYEARVEQARDLRAAGLQSRDIAARMGVTTRMVRYYLTEAL